MKKKKSRSGTEQSKTAQSIKQQFSVINSIPVALCLTFALFIAFTNSNGQKSELRQSVAATNDLARIADGGIIVNWLLTTELPSDIDAGTYENFQRFNIEHLPQRDWLVAFGGEKNIKPRAGAMRGTQVNQSDLSNRPPTENDVRPRADVPEVGANKVNQSIRQNISHITWREYQTASPRLDFASINAESNQNPKAAPVVGTAYAAAFITSKQSENLFLGTDRFLGSMWINGEKIYDGFQLDPPRVVVANIRPGNNLLMLRSTGVTGDYWRKDGGWTAMLRVWHARPVEANLFAGALRSTDFFAGNSSDTANTISAPSETLALTIFNADDKRKREIRVAVEAGKYHAESKIEELNAGEIRDVELHLPLETSSSATPRRTQVRIETSGSRYAWTQILNASTAPPDGTIFYLEGFHVDPVYLHDQRKYSRITLSNTSQYVNSLRADKSYGVFVSEIDYLKPFLDTHPQDRELLRRAVRDGRVGTGGSYNQFNELTIGGEAIIRNILYGRQFHEIALGDKPRAIALWDVFGHAPQLSQIASKSGFDGVVWSKKIPGFPSFFYDYALDGSRLLHRRLDYAYSFSGFGSGKNYGFDNLRRATTRKFEEARSLGSTTDLRINAADFTPPWTNLAGNVERLEANRPRIQVTGQAQTFYFDKLRAEIEAGKIVAPVTSRDKLFFHVGVAAARSDLKIAHRVAENITLTAERFGTLAYLQGASYPDLALDKAWRQILFGSHHDAITGTPSDNALLDLVQGYREAFELTRGALNDALEFLVKRINTNEKASGGFAQTRTNLSSQATGQAANKPIPLVVFNPVSWTRTDIAQAQVKFNNPVAEFEVRDAEGKVIAVDKSQVTYQQGDNPRGKIVEAKIEFVARDVPSLGYRTFYLHPVEAQEQKLADEVSPDTIENDFYRVTVDPKRGGAISSIYDKQAGREIVRASDGHLANEIAALTEELTKKNVIYPAWEFWTTGGRKFSTERAASVRVENSATTNRIFVEGVMPNMRGYKQTTELHNGVKRIDLRTELLDYNGRNELFVVNFPLALTGGALVTEERFGTVTRNSSKGFLDFRSNTDKLVSGAPVYSANNWVEYGNTLALRFIDSAGKTSASVPLRPAVLIRGHDEAMNEVTERMVAALIRRGISVTPLYDDNDAPRRAKLTIEDSTEPRRLNDDISYHSFRVALGTAQENSYTAELLKRIDANARIAFERRLAQACVAYLFVYDRDVPQGWQPVPVLIVAGQDKNATRKAVDNLLAPLAEGANHLQLSSEVFGEPEQLANDLQVPDYGVAVINNGTIAASLERPDTLTLFLTHTAPFPGINLPFEFVPEHKTHVFNYALYPHERDWRAGKSVHTGNDFNNPLIVRQTDLHDGTLPAAHSFLSVDKPNVILSALKLAGEPQANFTHITDRDKRKIIMRFYEADGRDTDVRISADETFGGSLREVNLLEQENPQAAATNTSTPFRKKFNGFSIETFSTDARRATSPTIDSHNEATGQTAELVQPVFSRYWLHNTGAAPIGNDRVKVSLRPVEQNGGLTSFAYEDSYNQGGTTSVAVKVQIVNNYTNRRLRGSVTLEVPLDWRVVPAQIEYDIEPDSFTAQDVIVVTYPVKRGEEWQRASGIIKARIEHDGQIFQDALDVGKPQLLTWRVERKEAGIFVYVRNDNRQAIEGSIALIAPLETWADGYASTRASPREQEFSVAANSELSLRFPSNKSGTDAWAIAKIAYNGHVEYLRADGIVPIPVTK